MASGSLVHGQSRLETLPVEILEMIASHLIPSEDDALGVFQIVGLRALCLTSRRLHQVATPFMYSYIYIENMHQLYTVLRQLLQYPELQRRGRALYVAVDVGNLWTMNSARNEAIISNPDKFSSQISQANRADRERHALFAQILGSALADRREPEKLAQYALYVLLQCSPNLQEFAVHLPGLPEGDFSQPRYESEIWQRLFLQRPIDYFKLPRLQNTLDDCDLSRTGTRVETQDFDGAAQAVRSALQAYGNPSSLIIDALDKLHYLRIITGSGKNKAILVLMLHPASEGISANHSQSIFCRTKHIDIAHNQVPALRKAIVELKAATKLISFKTQSRGPHDYSHSYRSGAYSEASRWNMNRLLACNAKTLESLHWDALIGPYIAASLCGATHGRLILDQLVNLTKLTVTLGGAFGRLVDLEQALQGYEKESPTTPNDWGDALWSRFPPNLVSLTLIEWWDMWFRNNLSSLWQLQESRRHQGAMQTLLLSLPLNMAQRHPKLRYIRFTALARALCTSHSHCHYSPSHSLVVNKSLEEYAVPFIQAGVKFDMTMRQIGTGFS